MWRWPGLSTPFVLSVQLSSSDPVYGVEGRGFTLYDLKRSLLAACGGYANAFYASAWDLWVWEIIEVIELAGELNAPKNEQDLGDLLYG